jgi:hypothetical protein
VICSREERQELSRRLAGSGSGSAGAENNGLSGKALERFEKKLNL